MPGVKVADSYIAVGADLAGYRAGLKQAETESQSLGAKIKAALSDPIGTLGTKGGALGGLIQDLSLGRSLTASLGDAAKGLGSELKSALGAGVGKVFSAGLGVAKTALNDLKNLAGQVGKGLLLGLGVGAGLGIANAIADAVRAIPDLITKGKDYAEVVHTIQITSGGTAESVSRLTGVMTELGVPVGDLTNRLGRLAVSVQSHEADLNALGVVTRDANGEFLTSTQLVENMRAVFSTLPAGIAKANLEVLGFGRGALGTMADYLTLTTPQLDALGQHAQDAGLVISGASAEMGEAVNRAQGNIGAALTGLANDIFATVGPTIVSVFDGIANAITTHAQDIANAIQSVVGWIAGLVSSLTGIDLSGSSFMTQVMGMGGGAATTLFKLGGLNAQLTALEDAHKKAKAPVVDLTAGLSAESKAIDKQVTSLNALEKQQDRTYKRGLDALNAQLDAQGKLFDVQDQKLSRQQRDLDLARGLRDAQEALDKTQLDAMQARDKAAKDPSLSADAKAQAAIDAARAVRDAEEALAQARQAMADETRTRAEEDRRGQIADVKTYLADVDKLVQDADNRKANLTALTGRENTLKAAGPAAPGSDAAIELQAVLAGEKRIRDAMANKTKIDALTARKDQLAQETAAVRSAAADQGEITYQANHKSLLKQIADEKKAIAERQKNQDAALSHEAQGYGAVFGEGGSVPAAFKDAMKAGVDFGNNVKAAISGIGTAIGQLITPDGPLAKFMDLLGNTGKELYWIQHPSLSWEGILGPDIAKAFGVQDAKPGVIQVPQTPFNHVGGGLAGLGGRELSWLGERRPEYVLPSVTDAAARLDAFFRSPSSPATAMASVGGQPAIIRLEIGGTKLLDYVDQNLAYRRVRRT